MHSVSFGDRNYPESILKRPQLCAQYLVTEIASPIFDPALKKAYNSGLRFP